MSAGTIFVVDDDPIATESLKKLLELETPHRVRVFQVPVDALEAVRTDPPDLLITDLNMPSFDGIALLRQARKLHPDGARILLTGYADKESAIRAVNTAGIYQYVEKPWDNAQLLQLVENALERVDLTRKLRATVATLEARNAELERTLVELHAAQERLMSAERLAAVGRVAGGIAHEIGNQLALLGYVEMIAERHADDPETLGMVEPVLAARRRLGVMISAIKDFVRGATDTARYPREPQALSPVVDEALSILRFEPSAKLRRFERSPDDREARAHVSRDQILQVLLNLIRNAMQATGENGRIRIGVARTEGRVRVSVEDDGAGIPPEHLERIWEPFFSTKGDTGTGLGLGICRRIVEQHGGAISAASSPGAGARFEIDLPAVN